jgi:excisionase family DNA binding protein
MHVNVVIKERMMNPGSFTTSEAASKVGITRATLQDWIKKGKFAAPKLGRVGGIKVRFWTASDVARLKAVKKEIYQEKRRRK